MRSIFFALLAGSTLAGSALVAPSLARAEAPRKPIVEVAPQTVGWIGPAVRRDGRPADRMQVIEPPKMGAQAAGSGWVLYLNHMGGTYTPGDNDSRTNRSSIPSQQSQIAPWNIPASGWTQVLTCVQQEFAPFDIRVTDVDPGNVPHIEAVVAGSPADVQMDPNVGGVSPFTTDCSVIPNSIVYAFAQLYGNDYNTVCEVVAQEVAHSFGLDHEYLASDPMTYLNYNGHKTFQNQTTSCGEYSARQCGLPGGPVCSATQNSVTMLNARIGAAQAPDTSAPTVGIASPSNNATVPPGFTVMANASDDKGVSKVELYIDGTLADTKTTGPYTFVTAASIADGLHTVETRAYDSVNVSSSTVTVTVRAGAPDPTPDPNPNPDPNPDPSNPDDNVIIGGCSTGGAATPSIWFALGALGLLRRRRK